MANHLSEYNTVLGISFFSDFRIHQTLSQTPLRQQISCLAAIRSHQRQLALANPDKTYGILSYTPGRSFNVPHTEESHEKASLLNGHVVFQTGSHYDRHTKTLPDAVLELLLQSANSVSRSTDAFVFKSFDVALAVDAVLWWRYLLTPPLSLSIRNVVPTDVGLFAAVARGNVDFLLEELENGQGRPTDIGEDGSTLAYAAVAYHQYAVLQLLLKIGVDPHWENDFKQSAYDRAWEGVFVQDFPGKPKPSDAMSTSIFHDKTRVLEDWGLTRLHKIILGLETGHVEAELRSGAPINAPDRFNRTPLFWACGRGDLDTVRLLLDRGADPNVMDTEGSTALRRCHGNRRLDIARLLVSRGADVRWRTKTGMGGLHSVASYGMPVEWFSLYAACDTEARGGQTNLTPLAIACKYNRPAHASWLLAHGASPRTTVAADHTACAALLLRHAAHQPPYAPPTARACTPLLAAAAAQASVPTLDALAAHGYGAHVDATGAGIREVLGMEGGWMPGEKPALRRVVLTRWCERCGLDAAAGVPAEFSLREESGVGALGRLREGRWGWGGLVPLEEGGEEEEMASGRKGVDLEEMRRQLGGVYAEGLRVTDEEDLEERRRRTPHRHGLEVPPWVFGREVFEAGEEVEWVIHEGKVLQRFVMIGGHVTDMWRVRAVLPGYEMETDEEDRQGSGAVSGIKRLVNRLTSKWV